MSDCTDDIDDVGSDAIDDAKSDVESDAKSDISKRIDGIKSRIDTVMAAPKKATKKGTEPELTFCKCFPTSDQTNGIEPFYVRLCATISGDDYSHQSKLSEFNNLDKGYNLSDVGLKEPPKAVLYDDNKPFEPTNPPFVAVVAGTKLILAWRGSVTLMDWIRDFSFYVSSSFRWKNVAKVVKVHGGYLAMIDNTMAVHEDRLLEIVKENGIEEILITGHSLAGGAAQVAHLWFEGTMDPTVDPRPNEWKKLAETGLTVRCISFEGPSTTVFIKSEDDELNQKGLAFINQCGAKMCTTAFSMDPIPRLIGGVDFLLTVVENLVTDYESNSSFLKREGERAALRAIEYLLDKYGLTDPLKTYQPIAQRFQHIGKVLYYASPTAVPEVYLDNKNGILVDKEGNPPSLPEFLDIEYVPVEKDVLDDVAYNHLYIVRGPGLSYNRTNFLPVP